MDYIGGVIGLSYIAGYMKAFSRDVYLDSYLYDSRDRVRFLLFRVHKSDKYFLVEPSFDSIDMEITPELFYYVGYIMDDLKFDRMYAFTTINLDCDLEHILNNCCGITSNGLQRWINGV